MRMQANGRSGEISKSIRQTGNDSIAFFIFLSFSIEKKRRLKTHEKNQKKEKTTSKKKTSTFPRELIKNAIICGIPCCWSLLNPACDWESSFHLKQTQKKKIIIYLFRFCTWTIGRGNCANQNVITVRLIFASARFEFSLK